MGYNSPMMGMDVTYEATTPGTVYPTLGGSIGLASSANSAMPISTAMPVNAPSAIGYTGNPVIGFAIFITFTAVIMWAAHRFSGEGSEFKNIRASFYNILYISLVAVAGIPAIKLGFGMLSKTRFPGTAEANAWATAA